ncbi:MAG: aquaporin family protein [Synergistaceae bacterium]|nr:aquaporin family protein [Synergistaceae bacterium]MBR0095062.1 aquaporin family protein [Synergistaceae bacterium]
MGSFFTPGPVWGELFGTLVLVVFGDGNVAAASLKDSKGNGAGWVHICWGWAWAVVLGIFAANAMGSAQADINPAVTVAKTLAGVYETGLAIQIIIAQFIGAILGAVLVWLAYYNHWEGTDNASKLGVFATGPARRNLGCNFVTEIIATFFLVTVINCIFSKGAGITTAGLGAYMVGGLIYGCGAALGGPTGYSMNPARDLGPRIAHFILPFPGGKGSSDWGYSWVGTLGPVVGAVIAFYFCRAFGIM